MLSESFLIDLVPGGKGGEEVMEGFLEKVAFKLRLDCWVEFARQSGGGRTCAKALGVVSEGDSVREVRVALAGLAQWFLMLWGSSRSEHV